MSNKITVSIIIPTHNRRTLLEETIKSVVGQNYKNWELLIIDDFSTDDTWKMLESIDNEKIQPVRMSQNVERSRARNIGLEKSKGKYVLFLDDDDLLTEHALSSLVESLETSQNAIASIGGYMLFDEKGNTEDVTIVKKQYERNIFDDFLFGWMATAGHSLFRTSVIRAINGWNESSSFAEDHELWLKISLNKQVVLIPDIVLEYRVHGQWRPENQNQIMDDIRLDIVNGLTGKMKNKGEGILNSRKLRPVAEQLYNDGKIFKAFVKYFAVAFSAPSLLFSPLSKKHTLIPLLKCMMTSYGLKGGKKILSLLNRK